MLGPELSCFSQSTAMWGGSQQIQVQHLKHPPFSAFSHSLGNPWSFLLIPSNSPFLYCYLGISVPQWLALSHEEHNVLIGSQWKSLEVTPERKQGPNSTALSSLWLWTSILPPLWIGFLHWVKLTVFGDVCELSHRDILCLFLLLGHNGNAKL